MKRKTYFKNKTRHVRSKEIEMKNVERYINAIVKAIIIIGMTSLGIVIYHVIELYLVQNTDWKFLKNIVLFLILVFHIISAGWVLSVLKIRKDLVEKLSESVLIVVLSPITLVSTFIAVLLVSAGPPLTEPPNSMKSTAVHVSYTEIVQGNTIMDHTKEKSIYDEYKYILRSPSTVRLVVKRVISYKPYIENFRWNKINKFIILGICALESQGNPLAVGWHGEKGLMQIMMVLAQEYDTSLTKENSSMLFDPKYNLKMGVRHLNMIGFRQNDDLDAVIASYNTSPGWYDSIRFHSFEKYGYYSPSFWEMRSFFPIITQRYVPKVYAWAYILEYYDVYGKIPNIGAFEPRKTIISFENKLDRVVRSIPEFRVASFDSVSFIRVMRQDEKNNTFPIPYSSHIYDAISTTSNINQWEAKLVGKNIYEPSSSGYQQILFREKTSIINYAENRTHLFE